MTTYSSIRTQEYQGATPFFNQNSGEVILSCFHIIDPGTHIIKWIVTYATPYVAYAPAITVQPDQTQACYILP